MSLGTALAGATLLSTVLVAGAVAEAAPFAYVTNEGGGVSQFDAFGSGLLTPLTPPTITAGAGPRGIAIAADGNSLYVANNTSANAISQYSVGSDGKLTPKTPAAVGTDPDADQRAVYIAASPNGRDVYANSGYNGVGGGAISQYTVQPGGTLAAKSPSYVFTGESGGLVVSPDGKSVYETGEPNTVRQYDVSATDGTLSPKSPSSVTGANGAFHLAVAPNGKTLYVANYGSPGSVSQFAIDESGKLTAKLPATVVAGNGALEPAVSPNGDNLYVVNAGDGTLSQYDIGADGSLTAKAPATVAAGASPVGVAVSANGSSVYVADRSTAGKVFQFDVGAGGALSAKSVASVAAGQYPRAIAVTPGGPPPDVVAPTIMVTTPAESQHFAQGQTVSSVFSCNDGSGSGVQTCSGPTSVATDTAGARQFIVTASDVAGNNATKTVNYVVDAPTDATFSTTPTTTLPPPPIGLPLVPPPPPVDTTAPAATLAGATQKLGKTIVVSIKCSVEACTAKTSASVRVPAAGRAKAKSFRLTAVRTAIAKGQKVKIKLKLSATARTAIRRALNARKRVVATVKLTVADAAGNKKTLTRQVRLTR